MGSTKVPVFDGNAEQLRLIVDQLADAVIKRLDEEDQTRTFHTDHAFQEWLDKKIKDKLVLWAAGIILAYAGPIIIAAFYVGSMNEKLDVALTEQTYNTQALRARSGWINDQEDYNCELKRAIEVTHPAIQLGPCNFVSGENRNDPRR